MHGAPQLEYMAVAPVDCDFHDSLERCASNFVGTGVDECDQPCAQAKRARRECDHGSLTQSLSSLMCFCRICA